MRRREILSSKTYPDRERIRGEKIFQPGHVLSTESISSGYNTDQFAPVDTDTMDTQDYELWERRRPVTGPSHEDNPSHEDSPGIGRNRKIMRSRAQVKKVLLNMILFFYILHCFRVPFLMMKKKHFLNHFKHHIANHCQSFHKNSKFNLQILLVIHLMENLLLGNTQMTMIILFMVTYWIMLKLLEVQMHLPHLSME